MTSNPPNVLAAVLAPPVSTFEYRRGKSVTDEWPEKRSAADFWSFIDAVLGDRACVKNKTDTPYLCGPLDNNGRRCAENAGDRSFIVADVDHCVASRHAEFRTACKAGFQCAVWSTHSSTPDAPRDRVFIALDRRITRTEGINIGRVLDDKRRQGFGDDVRFDLSTFRCEQPIFVPPTGVVAERYNDAPPLNVETYLAAAALLPPPPRETSTGTHADWKDVPDADANPNETDKVKVLAKAMAHRTRYSEFGNDVSFADVWMCNEEKLAAAKPSDSGDSYDRSRADYVVALELAHQTGCNPALVEEIMLEGPIEREKYHKHDAKFGTYLRRTILKACAEKRAARQVRQATRLASRGASIVPPPPIMGSVQAAIVDGVKPFAPRAPRISLADLHTSPSPPQRFVIDPWLPFGVPTLIGGHGGTGKSQLQLHLGVCVASDIPFMGLPVTQCKVLIFSAEDSAAVVRRRLAKICTRLSVDPAALAVQLRVLDGTNDPVLYDGEKEVDDDTQQLVLRIPPAYSGLKDEVAEFGAGLIIIDNASDVFDSNEIERARVREFVRLLAALGTATDAGVLLLAHLDKQTVKTGSSEGYSGSTAWHNSARSRWFLSTSPAGLLQLEHQKSNLAPRAEPLFMKWTADGVLEAVDAPTTVVPDEDRATVLRLVAAAEDRNQLVSPSRQSTNYVHSVISVDPTYPKWLTKPELDKVVQALKATNDLVEEMGEGAGRNKVRLLRTLRRSADV